MTAGERRVRGCAMLALIAGMTAGCDEAAHDSRGELVHAVDSGAGADTGIDAGHLARQAATLPACTPMVPPPHWRRVSAGLASLTLPMPGELAAASDATPDSTRFRIWDTDGGQLLLSGMPLREASPHSGASTGCALDVAGQRTAIWFTTNRSDGRSDAPHGAWLHLVVPPDRLLRVQIAAPTRSELGALIPILHGLAMDGGPAAR